MLCCVSFRVETSAKEERAGGSEEQEEHQFSDVEESEDDDDNDDDEEEEEECGSHDDPPSSCSSDTHPSSAGQSSCSRRSQQGTPDPEPPGPNPTTSGQEQPARGVWPSRRAASPSSRRALFSRRPWKASPRAFSPSSESCSPSRSLSPRLELSSPLHSLSPRTEVPSPSRHVSYSPERGPSPIRPLSPLRPVSPSCCRPSQTRTPTSPPRLHQRSPGYLPWESPGTKVTPSVSLLIPPPHNNNDVKNLLEGFYVTTKHFFSAFSFTKIVSCTNVETVCLLPLQEIGGTTATTRARFSEPTLFPPALRLSTCESYSAHPTADHIFSHLPMHSQQAKVPCLMIPIGGIQMVQARPRSHPTTPSSPTSPSAEGPSAFKFESYWGGTPRTQGLRTAGELWSEHQTAAAAASSQSGRRDFQTALTCSTPESGTADSKQYGSSHSSAHTRSSDRGSSSRAPSSVATPSPSRGPGQQLEGAEPRSGSDQTEGGAKGDSAGEERNT